MARDIFGRLIREDMFGRKISKKQIKREVIADNRRRGKIAEDSVKMKLQLGGYEVERSPHGRDFIARKRDLFTGRITQTKHIEVKSGKAKLSKLQEKTKKNKSNYKVIREDPLF